MNEREIPAKEKPISLIQSSFGSYIISDGPNRNNDIVAKSRAPQDKYLAETISTSLMTNIEAAA